MLRAKQKRRRETGRRQIFCLPCVLRDHRRARLALMRALCAADSEVSWLKVRTGGTELSGLEFRLFALGIET